MSIREFVEKWQNFIVVGVLLVAMALVLSLPTIKTLKAIEIKHGIDGVVFEKDKSFINKVRAPKGKLDYLIAWIHDEQGADKISKTSYETISLEVVDPTGKTVRKATKTSLIKRNDQTALLFSFNELKLQEGHLYTFVLKQTGKGLIKAWQPNQDFVEEGEAVVNAIELGEKKNWLTLMLDKVYGESLVGDDISFYLHRGMQIAKGENPYACVLKAKDACVGYPAHLPGIYLFAAGFAKMGVDNLDEWGQVWRPIMTSAWFGIGILLFVYLFRRGQPALAVAALGFWLFNRWSLDVLRIAHTDFVAILFLLLAIILAERFPKLAAILFGVSLSIKQLALLILPIFLLTLWRQKNYCIKYLFIYLSLSILMPVATTLPFFIDNPAATTKALLNVVERPAQSVRGFAPAIDEWLDVTHIGKSIIMLFLIGAVYVSVWKKEVGLIWGTLMIMAIIMGFSSVLYNQYFIWFIPFIPLAIANLKVRFSEERTSKNKT